MNEVHKMILNNVIPFINGITIVLFGIYLWTVRKECHMMEKYIRNKKLVLNNYSKDEELLNMYDKIEKN